jgi:hypothetical protein
MLGHTVGNRGVRAPRPVNIEPMNPWSSTAASTCQSAPYGEGAAGSPLLSAANGRLFVRRVRDERRHRVLGPRRDERQGTAGGVRA